MPGVDSPPFEPLRHACRLAAVPSRTRVWGRFLRGVGPLHHRWVVAGASVAPYMLGGSRLAPLRVPVPGRGPEKGEPVTSNDLLLSLVRRERTATIPSADLAHLREDSERTQFLTLSARHSVHGLVLSGLANLGRLGPDLETIPARAASILHPLRFEAALWDLERDRVVRALELQGVSPVLLKGAALRLALYTEPVHRPLRDVDLLVPPDELEATLETMGKLGYTVPYSEAAIRHMREEHFHLRFVRERFAVEVHWDLSRPHQWYRLDAPSFLHDARFVAGPSGRTARVASCESLVVHLSAENLNHGTRLGRLVDIDRLISNGRAPDWDRLYSSALQAGLEVTLAVDLRLCQLLLGSPVPHDYLERLGVSPFRKRNLALLRPESWPFSKGSIPASVSELRRYWCTSYRFWRSRQELHHGADPLQWIWHGHQSEVAQPPGLRRIRGLSKRLTYQLWVYFKAVGCLLLPAGRHTLKFWTRDPRKAMG